MKCSQSPAGITIFVCTSIFDFLSVLTGSVFLYSITSLMPFATFYSRIISKALTKRIFHPHYLVMNTRVFPALGLTQGQRAQQAAIRGGRWVRCRRTAEHLGGSLVVSIDLNHIAIAFFRCYPSVPQPNNFRFHKTSGSLLCFAFQLIHR